MDGGQETRAKSVWETRLKQIPDLPPRPKNPLKDGSSKQILSKSAQNQNLTPPCYQKTRRHPYPLQAKPFSDAPH